MCSNFGMDPRLYDVHLLLKPGSLGDKRRMFCFFFCLPCSVALIKTDIKTTVVTMEDTNPTTAELKLPAAASLRFFLQTMEDELGFQDQVEELERLHMLMKTGECDLDSLLESDCIDRIHNSLTEKRDELARRSKTSKLWINYQHMLSIARALVSADRMGSWEMHLSTVSAYLLIFAVAGHPNYLKSARLDLQKMYALKDDNPEVHQKFHSGFHIIRRSSQHWSGLGSDLVIEQTLMRSLKSQGRLTRRVGCRSTREQFGPCHPLCHLYNLAMQDLTERSCVTSEQHKLSASRWKRDEIDLRKVAEKLDSVTPFSTEESLRNIIAGPLRNRKRYCTRNRLTIGVLLLS